MDELSLRKARMTAEIAMLLKQSKMSSLHRHRDAHSERMAREAAGRIEKLREAIREIDAELAGREQGETR